MLEVNGSLLIYFHRLDRETVSMDLVLDWDNLPDSYVEPTGTWFEHLDLS